MSLRVSSEGHGTKIRWLVRGIALSVNASGIGAWPRHKEGPLRKVNALALVALSVLLQASQFIKPKAYGGSQKVQPGPVVGQEWLPNNDCSHFKIPALAKGELLP